MLGKKLKQVLGSEKVQSVAQGAVSGALASIEKQKEQQEKKAEIRKEYIVAAAIIIAALLGRR